MTVHDPVALGGAVLVRSGLWYAESVVAAASTELIMHLTDWEEYRLVDPHVLGAVVARRNIIHARSALDEQRWRSAGWSFRAMGRPWAGQDHEPRPGIGERQLGHP